MLLEEIIEKFNIYLILNTALLKQDFEGDFKEYKLENGVHILNDLTEEHILKINPNDYHKFVDYLWSDGDGHMHRYAYNKDGEVSLMS